MKLMHNIFESKSRAWLAKDHLLSQFKSIILDSVPFDAIGLCSEHKLQVVNDITVMFLRCRLHYFMRFETR